jgi:hypothetical protein
VHRGDQLNTGVNARVLVIDNLQRGKGIGPHAVDGPDPNGKDRSLQGLRIAQFGLTGLGLQQVIGQRDDENLARADLIEDFLPPGFTAAELIIEPNLLACSPQRRRQGVDGRPVLTRLADK